MQPLTAACTHLTSTPRLPHASPHGGVHTSHLSRLVAFSLECSVLLLADTLSRLEVFALDTPSIVLDRITMVALYDRWYRKIVHGAFGQLYKVFVNDLERYATYFGLLHGARVTDYIPVRTPPASADRGAITTYGPGSLPSWRQREDDVRSARLIERAYLAYRERRIGNIAQQLVAPKRTPRRSYWRRGGRRRVEVKLGTTEHPVSCSCACAIS